MRVVAPQTPVIDVYIGRDGHASRLYGAPRSWRTPFSLQMDKRGDIFPVGPPDIADLDRFMWETDSAFQRRPTVDGGVEIVAKGRSAVTLVVWIEELVERGKRPPEAR